MVNAEGRWIGVPEYRAAVIGRNGAEMQVKVGTLEDVLEWLELAREVFEANEVRIRKVSE